MSLPLHLLPGSSALTGLLFMNGAGKPTAIKCKTDGTSDPSVTDDNTAGYGVLSVWINLTDDRVWVCVDATTSAAQWLRTDNSNPTEISFETVTSNTFAPGAVVRRSASSYVLAQANSAANIQSILGVVKSADAGKFTTVITGIMTLANSYTIGAPLYVSSSSAGTLTVTKPSGANEVYSRAVAVALNSTQIYVYPPIEIPSSFPWSAITGKDSAYPPSPHTHPLTDIAGGAAATGDTVTWNGSAWVPTTLATRLYILLQHKVAANNNGGNAASGWAARPITHTIENGGGACSAASSNKVTLAAGTYEFKVTASGCGTDQSRLRLWNFTDSVVIAYGQNALLDHTVVFSTDYWNGGSLHMEGKFTIAASKSIGIDQYSSNAVSGFGFGKAINAGGIDEIYLNAQFTKVA